ncbi:MAG: agmatine deiminase, partial [Candidatus Cloacimonetes bacterium]|nr:agmatine deiminase [Candidatus Cloacimonadota bacterium]
MKPSVLLFVLLIWTVWVLSAETVRISDSANKIDVLSSSASETILQYTIGSFERGRISINEVDFYHLRLFKEGITLDKGYPELPVFNRSIIIGNTARMRMEIYDITYQDFQMQIAPSKGVITRDINPETVPYTFGDIYQSKEFYPSQIAVLSEPYILREFRGITIRTIPFAYNPATKTLRVYTGYKVRVYAEGIDDVNVITTQQTGITQDFIPIYENQFLNWDNYRYTAVNDTYGKLLIIYYDSYLTQITPYVDWKKQKGIPTELVAWSTVGSNANQLQTYIQNRYNADNAITYVQLVGDAPQIPTLSSSGGGSDPSFSLVAGSDNYPDIFVGRFSAQTTTQVTDQINKVIAYERDLNTTATWLNKAMGIASADGGGGIGDLNESDITHMNYIRTDLLNYGYATVDQIYDPGALATTVSTNVNAGRGFINYVGHGSATSWGTTGFSSTNATNLTNGNMLPFIMSVACQNGNFVNSTCFAEAWLRNGNGGAVAMYASSIDQ